MSEVDYRPTPTGILKNLFNLFIWLFWIATAAQSPVSFSESSPEKGSVSQQTAIELKKAIDSVVYRDMELSRAPGAMVLVKKDGMTLFEKAYGLRNGKSKEPVTASTLFLTASVTKVITSAALLTVCNRKNISTDTQAGEILQGLPDEIAQLSLHQILSQSSGILDHWPTRKKWKSDPAMYFSHFGDRLLSHELKGVFSYTNFGHVLAGLLLTELHGKSFEESVRDILLTPLDMDQTTYSVTGEAWQNHSAAHQKGKVVKHEYTFPLIRSSASMFSTAGDLSKFATCFMNKGKFNRHQVIPEEVIDMMSGKYTPVGVLHNYFGYPDSHYGYGLMTFSFNEVAFAGHPGETTTQNILFAMAPDQKTSIVIMSNSGLFPFIDTFETLCRAYLNGDSGQDGSDKLNKRSVIDENAIPSYELQEYTGAYFLPSITGDKSRITEIYRKNRTLYLRLSGEETYKLTRLKDDLFSYDSPHFEFDIEVCFYRDESGKVKYLNNYWKTAVKSKP